jgi:hypothetical protein
LQRGRIIVAFDGAAQAMVAENADDGLGIGRRLWALGLDICVATSENQLRFEN